MLQSKVLSNGESPLILRVAKDGNRSLKSIGVSIIPEHWNFNKNEPKPECPIKKEIEQLIFVTQNRNKKTTFFIKPLKLEINMFTFNSIKDLISTLYKEKETIDFLFSKRKNSIKYENLLEFVNFEEEKLTYLIEKNILIQFGNTINLNEDILDFLKKLTDSIEEGGKETPY